MKNTPVTIEGSRVLLTGASSGIGRALALELGRLGARLFLTARRQDALQQLADDIASVGGICPSLMRADLSVAGQAGDIAARAQSALGGIDILINNAGASLIAGQAVAGDTSPARALFETNYWSPLALAAALVPAMRAQGRGIVINVTSTLQAVPVPLLGYYSASKTALARATQVMRHELAGSGIRVMEVVPGGTDTPTRHADRQMPVRKPLPRMPLVSPESTARAIIRGLRQGADRVVHPRSSMVPLELPAAGRWIAGIAASRIAGNASEVIVPTIR